MRRIALFATIVLTGCTLDLNGLGTDSGPDVALRLDAGPRADGAGVGEDADVLDAATMDAGTADGAVGEDAGVDAGPTDAGCVASTEVCDAADNDCDGDVDEDDVCGCPARMHEGRLYLFCGARETWDDARSYCQARGYDLAVLRTMEEESWVWEQSIALTGDTDTWMGLGDRGVEGEYRWLDGTLIWQAGGAVSGEYNNWRGGSPAEADGEDCVELDNGGGQWADEVCSVSSPFVCEAAAP